MGKKTPPFEHYPKWTEAKFWSFIRSGLRAKYSRWPPKYEVLNAAKRKYDGPDKRQKFEYQCAECTGWFKQKDVEVDHVVPCGSLRDYSDLAGFVRRLFVGVDGLRVVCKECHRRKTHEKKV